MSAPAAKRGPGRPARGAAHQGRTTPPSPEARRAPRPGLGDLKQNQLATAAIRAVNHSGIVPVITEQFGKMGAPRTYEIRTPFVLAIMHAYTNTDSYWTKIHAYGEALEVDVQKRIGFMLPDGTTIPTKRLYAFQKRLVRLLKAAPVLTPHNHFPNSKCESDCPFERLDINWLLRRLCAGSTPKDAPRTGVAAHDATDYETWASPWEKEPRDPGEYADGTPAKKTRRERAKKTPYVDENGKRITSCDHDAQWGHRTKTESNRSEFFYGYFLHLTVLARALGGPQTPNFVLGATLAPCGTHHNEMSFPTVAAIAAEFGIEDLLVDRGYSYLDVGTGVGYLRERGVACIIDLHPHDVRIYPNEWPAKNAAVQAPIFAIDGWWYCNAMPKNLHKLPVRVGFKRGEKEALAAQYDKRLPYAFKRRETLADGRLRLHGPARAGTLRCPNYPPSMRLAAHIPSSGCEVGEACSCAATKVIDLKGHPMEKVVQPTIFGTTEWAKSYGRRQAVESANSLVKQHYTRFKRGHTRVFTEEGIGILIAVGLAALNIRIERMWRLNANIETTDEDPILAAEQHHVHRGRKPTANPVRELEAAASHSPPT